MAAQAVGWIAALVVTAVGRDGMRHGEGRVVRDAQSSAVYRGVRPAERRGEARREVLQVPETLPGVASSIRGRMRGQELGWALDGGHEVWLMSRRGGRKKDDSGLGGDGRSGRLGSAILWWSVQRETGRCTQEW